MKTSEFIEKVEKLGFIEKAEDFNELILIQAFSGLVCMVGKKKLYSFNTFCSSFEVLVERKKAKLMEIVLEYAATPISERREKTIEEKAREYITACVNSDCDFFISIKGLEEDYIRIEDGLARTTFVYEETKGNAGIYGWYKENSNEFIKIWSEVSNND